MSRVRLGCSFMINAKLVCVQTDFEKHLRPHIPQQGHGKNAPLFQAAETCPGKSAKNYQNERSVMALGTSPWTLIPCPGLLCLVVRRRPVRESHFRGLTGQGGRRVCVHGLRVGVSLSPFSTGSPQGSPSPFSTRGSHILQTLTRGGEVAPTMSLHCFLFRCSKHAELKIPFYLTQPIFHIWCSENGTKASAWVDS